MKYKQNMNLRTTFASKVETFAISQILWQSLKLVSEKSDILCCGLFAEKPKCGVKNGPRFLAFAKVYMGLNFRKCQKFRSTFDTQGKLFLALGVCESEALQKCLNSTLYFLLNF